MRNSISTIAFLLSILATTFSFAQTIQKTNSTNNTSCDGHAEVSDIPSYYHMKWYSTDGLGGQILVQDGNDSVASLCPAHYRVDFDSLFYYRGSLEFTIESDSDPCAIPMYIAKDNMDPSGPDVCNGFLMPQAVNGHPPYTYVWSTGQTTNQIYELCEGFYTITATDNNGCTASQTFQLDGFTIDLNITHNTEPGECNGSVTTTMSDQETSGFIYSWSYENTSVTDSTSLHNLCSGIYSLLVQRTETYNGGSYQFFVVSDPSTTYGSLPYGDSLVLDTLQSVFQDCLFDYTNIDSAYLANAAMYNDSNVIVTWNVIGEGGNVYQFFDTLAFNGGEGVYHLVISVFCETFKSTQNYFTVNGQMYVDAYGQLFVGVKENALPAVLSVYPNPFTDNIRVTLERPDNYTVELTDASGRMIGSYSFQNENALSINTPSSLTAGAYFLKIRSGSGVQTVKVVR